MSWRPQRLLSVFTGPGQGNAFGDMAIPLMPTGQQQAQSSKTVTDWMLRVNRKLKHKERMQELKIYLVFMLLFILYFHSWRGLGTAFYMNEAIRLKLAKDTQTLNPPAVFDHISSLGNWWEWGKQTLVPALFADTLDNGNPMSLAERQYIGQTRLVGAMRLRQWRVRNDSCTNKYLPSDVCFAQFSSSAMETRPFGPSGRYSAVSGCADLRGGIPFAGREATYGCDGSYVLELPFQLNVSEGQAVMDALHQDRWLDSSTRAVVVEFYGQNTALGIWSHMRYMTEITASAYVMTSTEYRIFRVRVIITWWDYVSFAAHIAFYIFALYYLFVFLNAWRKYGILSRQKFIGFLSGWNLMEFVNHCCIVCMVVFRLLWLAHADRNRFADDSSTGYLEPKYPPLDDCCMWWTYEGYFAAANSFVMFMRFFKFINVNPRLNLLIRTVKRAGWTLFGMMIIAFISFAGFTLTAYIIYYPSLWEYRSLDSTISTLLRVLLGANDIYLDMRRVSKSFSPAFFLLYCTLGIYLILNMILAVIVESFQKEADDSKGFEDLGAQIMKKIRKILFMKWGFSRTKKKKAITAEDVYRTLMDFRRRFPNKKEIKLGDLLTLFDISQEQAIELMKTLDVDNSGTIDMDELEIFKDNQEQSKALEREQEIEVVDEHGAGESEEEDDNPEEEANADNGPATQSRDFRRVVGAVTTARNAFKRRLSNAEQPGNLDSPFSFVGGPATVSREPLEQQDPGVSSAQLGQIMPVISWLQQQMMVLAAQQQELVAMVRQQQVQDQQFQDHIRRQEARQTMVQQQMQQQQLLLQQHQQLQQSKAREMLDLIEETNRNVAGLEDAVYETKNQVQQLLTVLGTSSPH
eukprot:TRINITY_DN10056_c0_g1_i2.p1 TRINITY_DN10056_c0_g1~~TRINITY_DN10056_c0_g1_i2.p1  ORF type:complete len:874 (+),score=168.64 TRINITY_DN10056_c0_g1_i2:45-2624(+)